MAFDSVINGDQYAYGSNGKNNGSTPTESAAPNSGKTASSGVQSAVDYANAISDYMDQYNQDQTDKVNNFNAKEAQKNRDWQEYMAKHAHQFEVADLIAAGLNPVLSAGGQGAFVGNGAVASGQKAVADNTRAQAAMALLNNALYSSGQVAANTAKAEAENGNYTGAKITAKNYINWALKAYGLGIATFKAIQYGRNAAKRYYAGVKGLATAGNTGIALTFEQKRKRSN